MKTRRSFLPENNFLHSVLFPNKKSEISLNTIVPESPVTANVYTASISNTITASVLETPDDNLPTRNSLSKGKSKSSKSKKLASKSCFNDSIGLDETPDLNLKNRKGIISILESEYSDPNSNIPVHDNHNFSSKNRRKSYAETILPFDLNDDENLARKLAEIKKANCKRKSTSQNFKKNQNESLSPIINRSKNSKKNLVLQSLYNNVVKNSLSLNTSRNNSLNGSCNIDSKKRNSMNSQDATTISFDNSNLDLTDANCENEILVHGLEAKKHFPTSNLNISNGSLNSSKQIYNSSEIPNLSLKNINSTCIQEECENNQNIKNTPVRNYQKILEGEFSPINRSIFQSDKTFSPTQPASILILQGVTAIVDVRNGGANISSAFKELMVSLGAEVVNKFTGQVTHVIFKEGSRTTYHNAVEKSIHLVSPLWIEACRVKNVRVSESLFPITGEFTKNGKVTVPRKLRSIQPRDFDEAMRIAEIKAQRKRKKIEKEKHLKLQALQAPATPTTTAEFLPKDVNSPLCRLANLQKPLVDKSLSSNDESSGNESSTDEDCKTPLAMRLYNRLVASKRNEGNTSPVSSHQKMEDISCSLLFTKENSSGSSSTSHVHDGDDDDDNNNTDLLNGTDINKTESVKSTRKRVPPDIEIPINHLNNRSIDIKTNSSPFKNAAIERRRSKCLAGSSNNSINQASSHVVKDTPKSIQIKSNTLPSCSNISLSVVKRRKLHTVDFAPSQDLIIPSTPPTPLRNRDAGIYDSLKKQNTSQRVAMKRLKGKSSDELSVFSLPKSSKLKSSHESPGNNNEIIKIKNDGKLTPVQECVDTPKRSSKGRFSIVPRKRTSVEEFMPRSNLRKRMSRKKFSPKIYLPSICITGSHSDNIESLYAIIKSLGGFHTTTDVNSNTTHVVCVTERRTLNVLLGISQGCWILDVSWLYESVEFLKWAPEEPFELFNFCPGAKISRTFRLNKGDSFKPTFLQKLGRIYVSDSVNPPSYFIQDMLLNCGANICSTLRSADLIIGNEKMDSSLKQVSPKWLFDSIQHWTPQNLDDYLL